MKDITASVFDTTAQALGSVGVAIPDPHKAEYSLLAQILGVDYSAPLVFIGKRLYTPKVYNQDGQPCLRWGENTAILKDGPQLSLSYEISNATGFRGAHVQIVFASEPLAETEEVFMVYFPVATEKDKDTEFVTLAKIKPTKAMELVMVPSQTAGLPDITEVAPEYRGPVTVLGVTTFKGNPQYGGKDFHRAKVLLPDGKICTVKVHDSAAAITAPIVRQTNMDISGIIGETQYQGRVYPKLTEVTLKAEDLNLPN